MRINSLDVRAYGPFTNKQFDFSQGQGKLELIYGPNEAGKSSLLRTLCDFLFGIPVQTDDDFLHRMDSLRIGATIEHQGKSLAVLRRKGKGNTLCSEDEKIPISESEFRSVMPVDSRSIFETMFGINADRLAEGGRELMSGRGDFGKMLFSAASGIEDLRGILAALTADSDALFKVKGGSILKHLKECDELKKSISASLLTTSALADLTERREEAAAKKDRLGKELRDKGVEERRLERMREALDLLAQRQIKLAGLETLRMVRVARGGFETEFSRTEEALRHKREERQRIAQEAAALEGEITKLVFSESLLRHEGEISKLKERVGAERKAALDRVKLQANVLVAEARAAASFVELGIAADMESIPTLLVTAESRKQTADLDSQFTGLNADGKNASREIVNLESEIEGNHRLLAGLPEAKPTASLQQAMQATDLIAASAPDFTSRRARTAKDEKKLEADIRALPWHDSLDALESAALPSAALVEDWKQRMDRAETRLQKAREQWAASDELVRQCEAAIRQLQAGRSIPTLGAMENARRHRDHGWQAVRHAWLNGEIETGATPERLADAYQEDVKAADRASDDLREHASEAAHFAQSQVNLENANIQRQGHLVALETARGELAGLQPQWVELWKAWKIEARSPAQMADWLTRRARLMERASSIAVDKESILNYELQAQVAAASLKDALFISGATVNEGSLSALRTVAGNFIEIQQTNKTSHAKFEAALADGRKKLDSAMQRAAEVNEELSNWKTQWKRLLETLRMNPDLEPPAVHATLELRLQLMDSYKDWNDSRRRILGMDENALQFKGMVDRLTGEVAEDLRSLPPADAADQLYRRLNDHARNRELCRDKEKALAKTQSDLLTRDENLDDLRKIMDSLVAEAGCMEAYQIPDYIKQSNRRAELEEKLTGIETRLNQIAGIGGIEALEQEALKHSVDELPAEIGILQQALKQISEERDRTLSTETTLNNELEALERSNAAAEAAANLEFERANLIDETGRYVRLKLAEHVLKSAVESYRKKASGEMLQRSSAIFSQLTLGGFEGLELQWGEKNESELVGVRNGNSARLRTAQMSSGTCDQLYLALRVASLESYFRSHPPIPFIADDVLVHFDDERAAAALRILAGLARQTQVLLFTHHEHLLQVATGCLDAGELAVYKIQAAIVP